LDGDSAAVSVGGHTNISGPLSLEVLPPSVDGLVLDPPVVPGLVVLGVVVEGLVVVVVGARYCC
jgi:hypothetical protein